ncbi:MAG: acyl--CoA ligase [Actinobacteria bacterium]|nr:acyl--CoA ligase [Actinomycetota bacterium]
MTEFPGDLELPVEQADCTLGKFVVEIATRYGDREALVFGGSRFTYADLREEVRRAAKAFIAMGITKGARVAILLANRPEFVFAVFGGASVGAVVVPISTMASPAEREYVLKHCDACVLITQQRLGSNCFVTELVERHPDIAKAPEGYIHSEAFPFLRRIVVVGENQFGDGANVSELAACEGWQDALKAGEDIDDQLLDAIMAQVHPADDGVIIYTSGTTAHPKAVVHMHRAPCVQSWRWMQQLSLRSDDRVWTAFPYFWTAGFSMALGATLAAGACLVMQEIFEAGEALSLIEHEHVTTIHAFEHTNVLLAEHPDAIERDLGSLRNVRRDSPLGKVARITSPTGDPRAAFGLSETFTIATSIPSDSPLEIRMSTHGKALPGIEISILGSDSQQRLPTGTIGEIAVRGITLMRGYYKHLPEECFNEDGWFRTKDSGYLDDDGYLHWTGRISNLIKTGGANVSPVEVEAKVAALGVFGVSAVVGLPHPTLGEAVVLCGVPLAGIQVDVGDLMGRLREMMAHYKVPKKVLLFKEHQLSFTGSDKVRVAGVRELAMRELASLEPANPDDQKWYSFIRSISNLANKDTDVRN